MAIKTFENGLRAVCTEKADSNICSVVVHITGGCQSEKSNQSGLSEYVSRLLLCGTRNYPTKEALFNYAKLNGIILNSHASRESITLSAVCPNETLNWAMELLSEMLFFYDFDDAIAEKVKLGLLADVERLAENHNYTLEKSVNQALFYRTGLANPKYGTNLTVERFNAQVADTLAAKGYKPVFFGGTMDEEMVQEAVALMKTTPVVATGAFTIGALAAAMRRCSLIITNDSGPMHVAISQKVPIVAMYGPSSPKLYGPYTKDATIVTAVPPCMGCASGMKHKCNDMQCMTRLTVEQVVEAAEKMLLRGKKND